MSKFRYAYKCRICGEEFKGVGEADAKTAAEVLTKIKYNYEEGNCNLFDHHVAADHVGLADFIGFKRDGNTYESCRARMESLKGDLADD